MKSNDYAAFLRSKVVTAPMGGFAVPPEEISPALKPHQRDAVIWALKGGRRALFEAFGLGKTIQQLEWCRQVVRHEGGKTAVEHYHLSERQVKAWCDEGCSVECGRLLQGKLEKQRKGGRAGDGNRP